MGRLQIFTVYYYHVTTPYICFVGRFFLQICWRRRFGSDSTCTAKEQEASVATWQWNLLRLLLAFLVCMHRGWRR